MNEDVRRADGGPDSGPVECNENDTRACGPQMVGQCAPGRETCERGQWSACRGGVGPGSELCTPVGLDENCDGLIDEICDCVAGETQPCGIEVGECVLGTAVCGADSRWGACSVENTTGEEICNGLDEDCDGNVDETLLITYYLDEDGDGFGVGANVMEACDLPAGYATVAGDCKDSGEGSGAVYPRAPEQCNGRDDNCNGEPDEGLTPMTYYVDGDEDGFGTGAPIIFCEDPGSEYSTENNDCDDTTPDALPGGTEICDGLDNDCSGGFDEGDVCGCDGVNFSGHNYLFCVRNARWTQARDACGGSGRYRLVIINDAAEQTFLQAEVGASANRWWIGLDDRESEGVFRWIDNTMVSFNNFAVGEPNDSGNENCAEMLPSGEWNDAHCWEGSNFICESYD